MKLPACEWFGTGWSRAASRHKFRNPARWRRADARAEIALRRWERALR